MVHKLREVMGKRDDEYVLAGCIELDEGYFSTEMSQEEKDKPLKRGRGSQCLFNVFRIFASCLCHIWSSASASAYNRCNFFNNLSGIGTVF